MCGYDTKTTTYTTNTHNMHFLQHDYKDKIYNLHWAMNMKFVFWMKHPPVKPKPDRQQH